MLKPALAICAFTIAADSARNEIQLFPAGRFRAADGRPEGLDGWHLDGEIARRMIAAAAARRNPYVIDYEHQTLGSARNGQPAPAAGWFSRLEWREGDGLYATEIDWTARARAYIGDDEYRYISPVFLYDPDTGAVLSLQHAALTNDPALDGMAQALAAARREFLPDPPPEPAMLDQLLTQLGLKKGTTEDQALAAVTALKSAHEAQASQLAALRARLELDDDADGDQLSAAVDALTSARDTAQANLAALKQTGGKPDPAEYVSTAAFEAVKGELAQLRAERTADTVAALVGAGLEDGRLLPAQEAWARELGNADLAQLRKYLDTAQPIAALKATQTGGKQPVNADGKAVLTESQQAICKTLGMSEDDYAAALPTG